MCNIHLFAINDFIVDEVQEFDDIELTVYFFL